MVNSRLSLYNGTDWFDMPYVAELPISINKSISDIREPDKIKGSNSKSIVIPFSKESIKFFEFIYDENVTLNVFNPNLKTPAVYYIMEEESIRGNLQLLKVNKFENDNGLLSHGEFECNLVGTEGSWFIDAGDTKLEDLNYSDLNHAFTIANANWTPTLGVGGVYGFIDYGFGDTTNQVWKFTDLKYAIFEREYLRRAFAYLGYTWTSAFLDSTYYKHRILPDVNEGRMKQSSTQIDAAQFYAGLTAPGLVGTQSGTCNGTSWSYAYYQIITNVGQLLYNDDTTTPWFDGSTVYNTGTSIYTTNFQSWYQIASSNQITVQFSPPAGTVSMTGNNNLNLFFEVQESLNGGISWVTLAQTVSSVNMTTLGTYTVPNFVSTIPYNLGSGGLYRIFLKAQSNGIVFFYDGAVNIINTGISEIAFYSVSGNTFYSKIVNADIQYGQTVDVVNTVPKNVKLKDLFKSIIQTYNLRVEPSKSDPYNLIIEPEVDFYTGILDWTDKLDTAKQQEVIPMGDLEGRTYIFTYKQDEDKHNKDYQDKFKEAYGTERIDINNDFINQTKVNELIYSNTPIVGNGFNSLVVPKLYKEESGVVKPMKCNPRVLYWGGLKTCTPYTWDVNGTITYPTTYPYMGFVDDPTAPTIDLSFDNPFRLYWNFPALTFTNNNIYNGYWKRYIDRITDKNSKILRKWMYLNPNDIATFSFRKIVYIVDAYYLVNNIKDFNPLKKDSCLCEFVKLIDAPTFTPEGIGGGVGVGNLPSIGNTSANVYDIIVENGAFNYAGNYNSGQGFSYGNNNQNYGNGFLVIGDNNIVSNG